MVLILSRNELERGRLRFLRALKEKVFIYPTDTIYNVGCNAEDEDLVERVRELKEQFVRPLSVLAPGKEWVRKNCVLNALAKSWLKRMPGRYTLILKLKRRAVASNVDLGTNTIGVRIADHWFSEWVRDANVPLVATAVNRAGRGFMTNLDNVPDNIRRGVDFLAYDGELGGKPSTLVDVTMRLRKRVVFLKRTPKSHDTLL